MIPRDCYRVPISRGSQRLAPIISAYSADEAFEKAEQMAEGLLRRILPWQPDNGRFKPHAEFWHPVVIGKPVRIHVRGFHAF